MMKRLRRSSALGDRDRSALDPTTTRDTDPRSWVVKEKPSENDLQAVIRRGGTQRWRTARPPRDWRAGDRIFVWEASPSLRVVALATLTRIAGERDEHGDIRFWLRYGTDYLDDGPTAEQLRAVARLASASFLRAGPAGTVFPLTEPQAESLIDAVNGSHEAHPDELPAAFTYVERGGMPITVNRYERDRRARAACIAHHGVNCHVCGFNFAERYGAHGADFIHVHHLQPRALAEGDTTVDPVRDLRPVCPNCHAMLHRGQAEPLSISALRSMLRSI